MSFFPYPKFMLSQLKQCQKVDDSSWSYDIKETVKRKDLNRKISFSTVQIQGIIDQKPCDDVLIIKDLSGKAKLTNCSKALGVNDPNLFVEGMYCSVTGKLIRERGLPEVYAMKFTKMSALTNENTFYSSFWGAEVRDYQLFLVGATEPTVPWDAQ